MNGLLPQALPSATLLKERQETVAVAESSTGGLIAAALLAVPGASAYFRGGAVVYTRAARIALLGIPDEALTETRAATEAYALLLAQTVREKLSTTWGIAESGATGPTGNRYGDAAGHSCLAIVGSRNATLTIETGDSDREANMRAFTAAALDLLQQTLSG